MKVEQMDTTKDGVISYIKDAAKDRQVEPQSGVAMKTAVLRFFLDCAGITEKETRKEIAKQFLATPAWFGTNASAARQAMGIKADSVKLIEEFDV